MNRKGFIATVVILVSLPAVIAVSGAIAFRVLNRNNGSLLSSGVRRNYIVYVPRSYDPSKPAPLVISFHGAGGWPAQQMAISEWNRVAEKEKFIVVYPSGLDRGAPRVWRVERGPGLGEDVRFVSDLIDKLEATYNIDKTRIYANGLSNGGGMSFALSCTMSDRIAAVGLVAAAQTLPWKWCTDRRPVPMIAFHGTADPVIPYNGGVSWISTQSFPNMPIFIGNWARRNGCRSQVESAVAADVTLRQYTNCTDEATVAFYTVREGGHTWPGGQPLPEWFAGRTARTIDASSVMWAFFREHPLRLR